MESLREMLSERTIHLIFRSNFHVSETIHHRLKRCTSSSKLVATNGSSTNTVRYAWENTLCLAVVELKMVVAVVFEISLPNFVKLDCMITQTFAVVPLDMASIPLCLDFPAALLKNKNCLKTPFSINRMLMKLKLVFVFFSFTIEGAVKLIAIC